MWKGIFNANSSKHFESIFKTYRTNNFRIYSISFHYRTCIWIHKCYKILNCFIKKSTVKLLNLSCYYRMIMIWPRLKTNFHSATNSNLIEKNMGKPSSHWEITSPGWGWGSRQHTLSGSTWHCRWRRPQMGPTQSPGWQVLVPSWTHWQK